MSEPSSVIDLSNFEIPPCTLTGKINHSEFYWGKYHLNLIDPISVAECNETGMLYLCPRPNQKNRESMLAGQLPDVLLDYGKKNHNYASADKTRRPDFEKRLKFLDDYFAGEPDRTVLDVGTSSGTFLELAKAHGWQIKGIEPFPEDVKLCRSKGLDVDQGLAEKLPYPDNTFNVVHTSHVFEHLEDPLNAAREAYRVLKPGGLLFIEVPNQLDNFGFRRDIFLRRVSQRRRDITSVHHLWFFGRKTLRSLFERVGFVGIGIKNKYNKPFSGWRYPFSIASRIMSSFFYGTYIINGFGFKPKT